MGILAVVLGVFLVFSVTVSWVGGDREKALLEDSLMESRRAQAAMAAEAEQTKKDSYMQDERVKELQGRLGDSLIENNRLERAPARQEPDKSESGEDKSPKGIWEALTADAEENGGEDDPRADPRIKAAEESLRREAFARAEAEKKLVIEARALTYLETKLNETLEAGDGWRGTPAAQFCPWDPERR